MAETSLQNSEHYSSQEDISYVDEQNHSALICSICCQIFRDPIIMQCGHTFCRLCISRTTECPYDQEILQTFVDNYVVAEQINKLLVFCKYAFKISPSNNNNSANLKERDEHGCPVRIALAKKKEHENECIYRFVSCPNNCSNTDLRYKDIHNHLSICSKRSVSITNLTRSINHDQMQVLQEELISRIAQMEGLAETCKQLANTVTLMKNEIETLKINQEDLCRRNDLLLAELMKKKQESSIPTTIDERESLGNNESDNNDDDNVDDDVDVNVDVDDNDLSTVTLRCIGTFTGHNDAIWCLHALDDLLLSGSGDKTVKVWNLRETPYTNLATLYGHEESVLSLTIKDRTAFSGSADKSICIWNLNDFTRTASIVAHTDHVCALTKYDNQLYSSSNRCLKIWDMTTLELINDIQTDARNGWLRVLIQQDRCVYAGCRRVIKVFDASTHMISFEFELPTNDSIYSLAHSGTLLFAGALSGTIYIWDVRANRCLNANCQHDATVHGLCVLNGDQTKTSYLVSASSDKTIRVWTMDTFTQVQCDDRHEADVTALHTNSRHTMSGAADAEIKIWDCVSFHEHFE